MRIQSKQRILKVAPWLICMFLFVTGASLTWFRPTIEINKTEQQRQAVIQMSGVVAELSRSNSQNAMKPYDLKQIDNLMIKGGISASSLELTKLTPYVFGREYARGFVSSARDMSDKRTSPSSYSFPVFSISGIVIDKRVITMYVTLEGQPKSIFFKKDSNGWVLTTPFEGFGAKDISVDGDMFSFTLFLLTDSSSQAKYSFDRNGMRRLLDLK